MFQIVDVFLFDEIVDEDWVEDSDILCLSLFDGVEFEGSVIGIGELVIVRMHRKK